MFPEIRKRALKAGQPPGTLTYTGTNKNIPTVITVINYSNTDFHEITGNNFDCLPQTEESGITWINIEGLHDVPLIEKIAKKYNLHPLTIEDILNVDQRSKVEEFDDYLFITLKMLVAQPKKRSFSMDQLSIVMNEKVVITFQEQDTDIFNMIHERLRSGPNQRLRQKGSDYLIYRLIDAVVDQYFVVLEIIGDQIETIEEQIIFSPTPKNSRTLYRLKRQLLQLRKAIWPVREVISHLLQSEDKIITSFTQLYLRDVYDHAIQAIDTFETFRDLLSGLLDVYLSSLTNKMNEIMKVLTIISTIFIPVTFVASIYGMNFQYMPELNWKWGYPVTLSIMGAICIVMLVYFRRKKWI